MTEAYIFYSMNGLDLNLILHSMNTLKKIYNIPFKFHAKFSYYRINTNRNQIKLTTF
jgi:hypothetical protein